MPVVSVAPILNVHALAKYLYSRQSEYSPIKLHKGLYFLFAYYGALNKTEDGFPYLFHAQMEAWKYGSVIREVFDQRNEPHYFSELSVQEAIQELESQPEVKRFVDELIQQIYSVSDYSLVCRNHQDEAWQKGRLNENNTIDLPSLIQEYQEHYL